MGQARDSVVLLFLGLFSVVVFGSSPAKAKETKVEAVKTLAKASVQQVSDLIAKKSESQKIREQKKEEKALLTVLGGLFASQASMLHLFIIALLAGLLVGFTPPMYLISPVAIGVFASAGREQYKKRAYCALYYVFGSALAYSCLTYASVQLGVSFVAWVQHPLGAILIALFCTYLAFSLFGFYSVALCGGPLARSSKLASRLVLFLFGMLSGLMLSHHLSPALQVIMHSVSKVENPLFAFMPPFFFAIGISLLPALLGICMSSFIAFPRPHSLQDDLRISFGFILLALAGSFFFQLFDKEHVYLFYGILCLTASIFYFASTFDGRSVPPEGDRAYNSQLERLRIALLSFPYRRLLKRLVAFILFDLALYFFGISYLQYTGSSALSVISKFFGA